MNVTEKSPPHTWEQASIFPHKELRTEEPLAVEAHVFIMFPFHTKLRYTYCETDSFVHSVHGRTGKNTGFVSEYQSPVIPHRTLRAVSIEKLRPAQGTWL